MKKYVKRYHYRNFYISIEQFRDDEEIPHCFLEVVRPDGREITHFPFSTTGWVWQIQERVEKYIDSVE